MTPADIGFSHCCAPWLLLGNPPLQLGPLFLQALRGPTGVDTRTRLQGILLCLMCLLPPISYLAVQGGVAERVWLLSQGCGLERVWQTCTCPSSCEMFVMMASNLSL